MAGIRRARDADLYLAPGGDTVFLFNRRVFREVGWFDERFRGIGFHEWDWETRAILGVGQDRVVIEDKHGWYFNAVGLDEQWLRADRNAPPTYGQAAWPDTDRVFQVK